MMSLSAKDQLNELFVELNAKIEEINIQRRRDGDFGLTKARVQLLGQVSLLVHEAVSAVLSLAQTGDLDALLDMEYTVKKEFKIILQKQGLVYDEDSYLIWIPPGARFDLLFDLDHVMIEAIDPESALVSKAVKAPEKNRQLIRQAIAAEKFPTLVDRILENGGRLEDFL